MIHLSIYLSICLSVYLSFYLSIYLSIYLSTYLSIYPFHLSIHGNIHQRFGWICIFTQARWSFEPGKGAAFRMVNRGSFGMPLQRWWFRKLVTAYLEKLPPLNHWSNSKWCSFLIFSLHRWAHKRHQAPFTDADNWLPTSICDRIIIPAYERFPNLWVLRQISARFHPIVQILLVSSKCQPVGYPQELAALQLSLKEADPPGGWSK